MLFKHFLLEGRPFYDEHGNKYVASKNDHYSKNGEEITKQEYDRVVHEIKNKQLSVKKYATTVKKEIKKNTEKNEKYLQELLPNAVIGFKSTAKNKEKVKLVVESVDELFTKYPKLKNYMANSFIGDYNVLKNKIDEINNKAFNDKSEITKSEMDGFISSFDITFKNNYVLYTTNEHYKNGSSPVKYFLYNFFTESEIDNFLLDNHIKSDDQVDIFKDKKLEEKLKETYINSRIKNNLTINQYYLPNPKKCNLSAYYIPSERSHLRGIVINQNVINDEYYIHQEPESYENFNLLDHNHLTLKCIISHEIGHSIDKLLNLSNNKEIQSLFYNNLETITEEVSGYAITSIEEFIAECFAEYHLSGNPKKIPKKVGEIIDKLMEEK